MKLRDQIETSLRAALKAREAPAIAALRSALSAIDNAAAIAAPPAWPPKLGVGAGEAERKVLSTDEVQAILGAEIAERISAAAQYDRLGRPEEAARLRAEAGILAAHVG